MKFAVYNAGNELGLYINLIEESFLRVWSYPTHSGAAIKHYSIEFEYTVKLLFPQWKISYQYPKEQS